MRIVFEEAPLLEKTDLMRAWCDAWSTHPSHAEIKAMAVDRWFAECEKRLEKLLPRPSLRAGK